MRFTFAAEKEVLNLGSSSTGGLGVVRLENRTVAWNGVNSTRQAHIMDERGKILKNNGATFFKNPKDCEYVKPLLDGFGAYEEVTHYEDMRSNAESK
jgi:hypothetical protein